LIKISVIMLFVFFGKMSCAQEKVKEPLGELQNNHPQIQILQFDSSVIKRDYFIINDTNALRIDTLKQIWQGDTFNVYRYYSHGELIRTEKYYQNGILRHIKNYVNGKPHGHNYSFYENGKLSNYTLYHHWKILSSFNYYESGMLKYYLISDTLAKTNTIREYYESGKIMSENTEYLYKDTLIHDIDYYESGNVISENYFNNGKQKFVAYFDNGNVMEEYTYIDMNLFRVGELKYYYENGQLKHQAFFKDGDNRKEANIKTGTWSYWDEKGKLIGQEIYKNNELIDTKEFFSKKLKGVEK
jgi:antitoxin component YwqK of YwqJK toxin-antitoxin module